MLVNRVMREISEDVFHFIEDGKVVKQIVHVLLDVNDASDVVSVNEIVLCGGRHGER